MRKKPIPYINNKKRVDSIQDLPVGLMNIKTSTADHITATVVLNGNRKTFSRSYGQNSRFKRTRVEAIKSCREWRESEIKLALLG